MDTLSLSTALEVQAIPHGIRKYLTGLDLKRLVLVNRQWWRIFAPFLWEKLFINETDDGQTAIVFRNGQVVQELTVVVPEHESKQRIETLFETLAKACPNITTLHLKLYSTLCFDANVEEQEDDHEDAARSLEPLKNLYHLLSLFPNVTTLNLNLAHANLPATVVLAATQLPYLHELGVFGGLRQKKYTLHKNRRCDWDTLFWTAMKCPRLRTLRLAWRANHSPLTQELQDALVWIEQAEAVAESTVAASAPWLKRNTNISVSQANVPVNAITTTMASIPPQLTHLRLLHLEDMDCPVASSFARLMYHCPHLQEFFTHSIVHRLDLQDDSRRLTANEAMDANLCTLLDTCGPSLRRLDLSPFTFDTDSGDNERMSTSESWTSRLIAATCQGLNQLTIHTSLMQMIQEPNHMRWITHLTAGPIYEINQLNMVMEGFPALAHVSLYGNMALKPEFYWHHHVDTDLWSWEPVPTTPRSKYVMPWRATPTLKSVDVSQLTMGLVDEIESLYDAIRALDKLEKLAMPIKQMQILEKLAHSLEAPVSPSTEVREAPSPILGATLKTQLFPRSLHTLYIRQDEDAFYENKMYAIQANKHYARIVFDMMPGVKVMQIDHRLVGGIGRQTFMCDHQDYSASGSSWAEVSHQKKVDDDDNVLVPELDQPKDRHIRYEIRS